MCMSKGEGASTHDTCRVLTGPLRMISPSNPRYSSKWRSASLCQGLPAQSSNFAINQTADEPPQIPRDWGTHWISGFSDLSLATELPNTRRSFFAVSSAIAANENLTGGFFTLVGTFGVPDDSVLMRFE